MRFITVKPEAERQGPKIPAAPYSDFDRNRHYWPLQCGHMADLDTDAVYRIQSSPRDKLWCDTCEWWKKPKRKPKPELLPEHPMF